MNINPHIINAAKVLDGIPLTRSEALAIAENVAGEDVLDLISLANKVRKKFASGISACSILNAKSGKCGENCRFCAQSGHHQAKIECYPLLSPEETLEAAKRVYATGIRAFGYVTSGRGYLEPNAEFMTMLETFDLLYRELPELKLCVSIGILSRECARMLAEHHVWRYNMNLQTSPARYREIVSTSHTIEEKLQTIKFLREFGITICAGGIFGLGESWGDRVDFAFAVKELEPDGVPLNILLPIPGTPLEKLPVLSPGDAAKCFALFRLINPSLMLKFCAGRETVMKDFQGLLMLSGLNALMTGGYLTTRGRDVAADEKFIAELQGF